MRIDKKIFESMANQKKECITLPQNKTNVKKWRSTSEEENIYHLFCLLVSFFFHNILILLPVHLTSMHMHILTLLSIIYSFTYNVNDKPMNRFFFCMLFSDVSFIHISYRKKCFFICDTKATGKLEVTCMKWRHLLRHNHQTSLKAK